MVVAENCVLGGAAAVAQWVMQKVKVIGAQMAEGMAAQMVEVMAAQMAERRGATKGTTRGATVVVAEMV